MSYQNLLTARYGEITPFFVFDAIGRDRVNLSSSHEVRTTTLQSPMMSSLRMRKTYASMPYSGILPNTWQYIFTNPKKGDRNSIRRVDMATKIIQQATRRKYSIE